MSREFDIIIATDTRLLGGGNKSIREEVLAHSAVGYTTGIYPVYRNTKHPQPVDSSIRELLRSGRAELLKPGETAHCRLLIARGPGLFNSTQSISPNISADRQLFVINALSFDSQTSKLSYDPLALPSNVEQTFPGTWEWSPLSPLVRKAFEALHTALPLTEFDWHNIVDSVARPLRSYEKPILTIGRHGRDNAMKWPASGEELLAAYPIDDPRFQVAVLGGVASAEKILGFAPEAWRRLAFDEVSVDSFLSEVDIYSYFHNDDMTEAFGRSVLEAMASGLPCVLPRYMRATFGDTAAVYCDSPFDAPAAYARMYEDRELLKSASEAASAVVRDRFSSESHVDRIAKLIGPPSAETKTARPNNASTGRAEKPVVLFYTDNGHGLGHLTRLLAVARRADGRFQPVFLTMSTGYQLLIDAGFPAEYFASFRQMGISRESWMPLVADRLAEAMKAFRPRAVVVDHVVPPGVLRRLRKEAEGSVFVWSRRGLWREGRNSRAISMKDAFDVVIEPGDIASGVDVGATAADREKVVAIPPVILVEPDEYLLAAEAREELGLPPDGRCVLLQLSGSDSDRLAHLIEHAAKVVREATEGDEASVFAPLHPLHVGTLPNVAHVTMKPVYPVARYLRAFDGVISTAGYNSYHEVVASGIPAVFVARESDSLDDQERRAEVAKLSGRGFWASSVESDDFTDAVSRMLAPDESQIALQATAALGPMNGAAEFARILAETVDDRRGHTFRAPTVPDPQDSKKRSRGFHSGKNIPKGSVERSKVVLIAAVDHSSTELKTLVRQVEELQNLRLNFKPVFLIGEVPPDSLIAAGMLFESCLGPQREMQQLGLDHHDDYLRDRLDSMSVRYGADRTIVLAPGATIVPWALP